MQVQFKISSQIVSKDKPRSRGAQIPNSTKECFLLLLFSKTLIWVVAKCPRKGEKLSTKFRISNKNFPADLPKSLRLVTKMGKIHEKYMKKNIRIDQLIAYVPFKQII